MKVLGGWLFILMCALWLPACGPYDCTPENCADGCCSSFNECISFRSDSECGPDGSVCEPCAEGSVCRLDQHTCYVGVMRTFIQPRYATIADVDPDTGEDWDSDGSPPDVVVEMNCPSAPERTRTEESESWDPEWRTGGCQIITSNLLRYPLEISIFDNDNYTFDDEFGGLSYQVTHGDLNRGRIELSIPPIVKTLVFDLSHNYAPR